VVSLGTKKWFFFFWGGGAFAKLRKATSRFVVSVHPSVRLSVCTEQLSSHWTDFHEIYFSVLFRKSVEKIQVSLKCDKNLGHFTCRPRYIIIIIRHDLGPTRSVSASSVSLF